MVGYFNVYRITGDEAFARRALASWEFIKERIIDRDHGEWYWSVDRQGNPRTDNEKAGFWKCPYHNGRACMEVIRGIGEVNIGRH
jgi:mannobiose 2-epimerase